MNETVALTVGLLSGLLIIAFVFWPVVRILRRLRLNPAWLALLIIPLALLILLWFLAYAKWPGNEQGKIVPSGWGVAICGTAAYRPSWRKCKLHYFSASATGEEMTGCFVSSTPVTMALRI
jgi:hypothetical protein